MADNIAVTEGAGKTVRTDEDGSGYQWQCIKIGLGADGTMNFWTVGSGNIDTGTPRVAIASDDVNLSAIKTAVETLDNAISGSEMQVDVVGALPAGTNAIGKLAANSGVDIGDVDILSIAAGDNNIGNVDIVTVPTDPFGANADAASATGSISAKLRRIATDLNAVVSGSEVQVDIVGALPAGTNNVGKVDHATTGFGDGVKTVTSAGTDEALAGSTAAKWVMIQAQADNTNKVAIGATGVDATVATGDGILLDPGDSVTIPCDNLADIFVDSLVNGEGVRYVYGT